MWDCVRSEPGLCGVFVFGVETFGKTILNTRQCGLYSNFRDHLSNSMIYYHNYKGWDLCFSTAQRGQ